MSAIWLGTVQVDPSRNMVANASASWSLEPKVMDLLVLFAAHPGKVLSREFLIEHVWRVEYGADESLTRAVSLLRKTFRDAGQTGEVIETIPKRGYRLSLKPTPVSDITAADDQPVVSSSVSADTAPPPARPETAQGAPRPETRNRPRLLPIAAIAGGLLVVALAVFLLRPQDKQAATAPTDQLIAFFGFSPANDDPGVASAAEAATDAMFEAIRSNWLGTVARTETSGTAEHRRFARAAELDARYALGGETRLDSTNATLLVRFEEVPSRLTLWEKTISIPAPDVAHLPAQAARQAAEVMWCIIKTRTEATRDTPELLNLIADRCRDGGLLNADNAAHNVARMRAVAEADPSSSYNQAQLVMMLGFGAEFAPAPTKQAWIAEGEQVLARTIALNPDEPGIQLGRISLAAAKNVSPTEWDALLVQALAETQSDPFVFGQVNGLRNAILASSGRFAEALPHAMAHRANDALASPWSVGMGRAQAGQTTEARAELEPVLAKYGSQAWGGMIPFAFFYDAPDAEVILRSPPSVIPQPAIACLRDIHAGTTSATSHARTSALARAHACRDEGLINSRMVLLSLAALGDLDGAFAQADKIAFDVSTIRSFMSALLFNPATREMRADPRFLPLVEKNGLMNYWRATKSQPDVCTREPAPFCVALKTEIGRP